MDVESNTQYQLPPNCRSHLTHSLWEKKFSQLMDFKKKYGHVIVPVHWKENVQLGTWVDYLRRRRRMGKLSEEWIKILDDHGFVWEFEDKKSRRLQPNVQRKKRTTKRRKSYDYDDDDDDDDEFDDDKLSQEDDGPEICEDEAFHEEPAVYKSYPERLPMERATRASKKSSPQLTPKSPSSEKANEQDPAYDSDAGIQALCNLACMSGSSSSSPCSPERADDAPQARKKKKGMQEEDAPTSSSSASPSLYHFAPSSPPQRCASPTDVLMRKMSRFAPSPQQLQNQLYSQPQPFCPPYHQQTEFTLDNNDLSGFKYISMPLKKRTKEAVWA